MQPFIRARLGLAALAAAMPLALPVSAGAAPDLRVKIVSVSPNTAAPGDRVTARTRLSNTGNSVADLNQRRRGRTVHIVRWTFKQRGARDKFVLARSMMGKLAPRRKKTVNAAFRIPSDAKPGMHRVCAEVDPTNAIRERNEGNNNDCIRIRIKRGSGRKGPQLKAPGGLKPQIRPDITGRGIKPIDPGRLQKRCPNPAIVELQVGIIRKNPRNRFQGTIQLKAVLKNDGNADYVTRPNQQSVQLRHGNKLLKNERFGNLRKGQVKIVKVQLPWNAAGEFQDDLTARIVYDPDIRQDGNKRNDDCNMRDNRKTVRPARVNRLFTG